ncbi:hypothetical protein DRQ07_05510 [candidate division KSB1 bacterium]|nr:MAG: hypothetical protein DRQ07_05510 [candidate division KSB1 bacterium]
MALPNFLIVGAAKAGTTSFFEYLAQHPEVYVPFCKEPHYFSNAPHPKLAENDEEYEKLFDGVKNEKAIGEASVTYLADPEAPFKIKNLIPDVRIIIFLRNPVNRAYSAWWQMYQLGYDNLDFQGVLEAENQRDTSEKFRSECPVHYTFYQYFKNGLYFAQVKRYFELFGEDKVKVYIFEEAVKNPEHICRDIFKFIGVNPGFTPEFKVYNASQVARFKKVQKILANPPGFIKKGFDSLPIGLKQTIYKPLKSLYWLNTKKQSRPVLDKNLKEELMKRYLPDIKKLEGLIGRNLMIWYKSDVNMK